MEEWVYTTAFAYFRAANDYDSSSNCIQHNNATTTLKVIRYKLLRFHWVNGQGDVPVTPDEYDDFVINAYDYDIIRQLFFGQLPEEDVEEEFRKSMCRFSFRRSEEMRNIVVFHPRDSRASEFSKVRVDDEEHRVDAIQLDHIRNIDPILEQLKSLPNLERLLVGEHIFESLPSCVGDFHNLKILRISEGLLERLPKEIGNLRNLEKLILESTCLKALPEEIGNLRNLKELNLKDTSLKALPEQIGNLTNLTLLDLSKTKLKALPVEIGNLRNLKELILEDTKLKALPEEIGNLTNLTLLDLSKTKTITSLPLSSMPPNLEDLILVDTEGLEELPSDIGKLTNLTTLDLVGSGIQSLPDSSKSLPRLHYLIIDDELYDEFWPADLVRSYPSLVSFGDRDLHDEELNLALACRRARISIRRGLTAMPELRPSRSRMPHTVVPKAALWPYILQHSVSSFNQYPPAKSQCTYYDANNGGYEMQEQDAIYQLLSNHQIVPRARIGLGWTAVPKLWPYVLHRSTIPFNHYHPLEPHPKCYKRHFDVQEQDAVYLLLSIHRDSFLGVLNNRGDSSKRKYPSV